MWHVQPIIKDPLFYLICSVRVKSFKYFPIFKRQGLRRIFVTRQREGERSNERISWGMARIELQHVLEMGSQSSDSFTSRTTRFSSTTVGVIFHCTCAATHYSLILSPLLLLLLLLQPTICVLIINLCTLGNSIRPHTDRIDTLFSFVVFGNSLIS